MAGVATPSTQKLNFQSAMQDFVTMFPHLDTHLIERVLRTNNGMVDQTIDHLLAISCDDPDVSGAFIHAHQSPEIQSPAQVNRQPIAQRTHASPEMAPPTYTQTGHPAYPVTPARSQNNRSQNNYPTLSSYLPPGDLTLTPWEAQPSVQKYGKVPVDVLGVQFRVPYTSPLPHAFLRLSTPITTQHQNSPLATQLSEDREFALFLHNEELLHQARNNSEFMRTLQQAESATHVDPATGLPPDLPACSTPASSTDTSISERLAVTGKATRSKLLKIAKRLHLAKRSNTTMLRKQSSVGKSTQRLISEEEEEYNYLFNEEEVEEEEIKTIPRQNTINGYEQASRDSCDVRIRSSRNTPPPPGSPPPGPLRRQPYPAPISPPAPSTLTRAQLPNTDSSTLTPKAPLSKVPAPLALLYEPDPLYNSEGPEYYTAEDLPRAVSSVQPLSSDGQSVPSDVTSVTSFSTIGTNEFDTIGASGFSRKIHSDTLNSSYIIPIQPVTLQDETVYDNLPNQLSRNNKSENLINFD